MKNKSNKSKEKTRQTKKRPVESESESDKEDTTYYVNGKDKRSKRDDESVDDSASDIGWNSDDEVAFESRRKTGDEEEEDYYSDEDEIEGGMLLSDMLDMPKKGSSKSGAPVTPVTTVTDEPDDDDDSADEADDNSEESESDLDEEYSEEAHAKLLKSMDKFAKSADGQLIKSKSNANQNARESTFSSMLDGSVSMNALLGALDNTQDLAAVRQQLTELTKSSAAPIYVDKVHSDRAERGQAYDVSKGDMSKWQETVVSNRHKRTLDLAGDKRTLPTTKQLVTKFSPTTAMEREISMVLVKHGTSDAAAAALEQDELQARTQHQMSEKEVRERQGELAKIKALMFYEQMKRHRLNKIKSKAYRTIQKRQRKREASRAAAAAAGGGAAAADDDDSENSDFEGEQQGMSAEQREQAAYDRVKERMDMRHSSTSKWSKMALRQGQQYGDKGKRTAYHESVLLGHELTAKMLQDDTSGDAGNSSNKKRKGAEDRDVYASAGNVSEDAAAEMQHILSGDASSTKVDGKYSKLFDMDFMRKAASQQRERSREEAESMLREIEQMEQQQDSDDDDNNAKKTSAGGVVPTAGVAMKRKRDSEELAKLSAARGEMTSSLGGGLFVAASAGAKKGNKGVVSSAVELSAPVDFTKAVPPSAGSLESDADANPWLMPASSTSKTTSAAAPSVAAAGANKNKKGKSSTNTMVKITHTPTSTTTATAAASSGGVKSTTKTGAASSTAATASAAGGVSSVAPTAASAPNPRLPARAPLLMQKSQADLVKIAFSGPDYEADFDTFKNKQIDDELGTADKTADVLKNVKAGWGDWAGPGNNQMISKKIQDKRDRLITKIQSESEAKRMERKDNKLMNVMISERRIKTASKYKIADIPHPYTSWEEYDRSLQMPLGDEWNASNVVKNLTQPEVKTRAGRIIEPVKLTKQMNKKQ